MQSIFISLFSMIAFVVSSGPAHSFRDAELIDGFNKTVFGSEYSTRSTRPYVRKFRGAARFFIRSEVPGPAEARVRKFIAGLPALITGLQVIIVNSQRKANFIVHVVPKSRYADTVKKKVFRNANVTASGSCMVRSIHSRSGIKFSDAVIVADQGTALFNRCMIEEILQGLGPLNDSRTLKSSMFNDQSDYTSLQTFDRFILTILYDPKIRPGASRSRVQPLIPAAIQRARNRIERNQ